MVRRNLALVLIATALTAVALIAGPSVAARPSDAAPCSKPELSGPISVRVGDTFTVNGCGFQAGSLVPLSIGEADGCCIALNRVADDGGKISYTDPAYAAGNYFVKALVPCKHGRWCVAATWSFQAA